MFVVVAICMVGVSYVIIRAATTTPIGKITSRTELEGPPPGPLTQLAKGASDEQILASLESSGHKPDDVMFYDRTLLCHAVRSGRHTLVIRLLELGADPNGGSGYVPFLPAISKRDHRMIDILLQHGADPDASDTFGLSGRSLAELSNDAWIRARFEVDSPEEEEGCVSAVPAQPLVARFVVR